MPSRNRSRHLLLLRLLLLCPPATAFAPALTAKTPATRHCSRRLKGGGLHGRQDKDDFLSVADMAWNQFFNKNRDGEAKDDYFRMALAAWEAASATGEPDDAVVGDGAVDNAVDLAEGSTSKKAKPMMDMASLFRVWGSDDAINNDLSSEDDDIPYGLRVGNPFLKSAPYDDGSDSERLGKDASTEDRPFFMDGSRISLDNSNHPKNSSIAEGIIDPSTTGVDGQGSERDDAPLGSNGVSKKSPSQTVIPYDAARTDKDFLSNKKKIAPSKPDSGTVKIDKSQLAKVGAKESLLTLGKLKSASKGVRNIQKSVMEGTESPSKLSIDDSQATDIKDSTSKQQQAFPARSFLNSLKSKDGVSKQSYARAESSVDSRINNSPTNAKEPRQSEYMNVGRNRSNEQIDQSKESTVNQSTVDESNVSPTIDPKETRGVNKSKGSVTMKKQSSDDNTMNLSPKTVTPPKTNPLAAKKSTDILDKPSITSVTMKGKEIAPKNGSVVNQGAKFRSGVPVQKTNERKFDKSPVIPIGGLQLNGDAIEANVVPESSGIPVAKSFTPKQKVDAMNDASNVKRRTDAKTSKATIGTDKIIKVHDLSEKKSSSSNQPTGNIPQKDFTLGVKGRETLAKTKIDSNTSKSKLPDISMSAKSFTSSDRSVSKMVPIEGINLPPLGLESDSSVLKGFVPKQSPTNGSGSKGLDSVQITTDSADNSVAKGFGSTKSFSDDVMIGPSSTPQNINSIYGSFEADNGNVDDNKILDNDTVGGDDPSSGLDVTSSYDDTIQEYNYEQSADDFDVEPLSTKTNEADEMPHFNPSTDEDYINQTDLDYFLQDIDDASLPVLQIGLRIKSNTFGPTHRGYLILAKEESESGYNILPCTVKRPWTVSEIKENLVAERQQSPEDWEVEMTAKTLANYFEVEYHCYQKIDEVKQLRILRLRQAEAEKENKGQPKIESDTTDNFDIYEVATPKLLGIYQDGGSHNSDIDVWGQPLGTKREWMVFTGGGIDGTEATLDQYFDLNQDGSHHLYCLQTALKLPESFRFGDVMDCVARSLVENLVFLTSNNLVHRNINTCNLNCDCVNQRIQLINFGGAVDLDPKDGKRIGLDTETSNTVVPGSIANSLAEDSCATAIMTCQLLFNLMDYASANRFFEQIKASSYDLDVWLKSQIESTDSDFSPTDLPAIEYLGERRGMWGLLKRMIQPNPMKRKLAIDSLKELKDITGLREGTVDWTDDFIVKVATEEAYLETLIDRFGRTDIIGDMIASDLNSEELGDDMLKSTVKQSRANESSSVSNKVNEYVSPKRLRKDVYYDITRSKLTSKYPLSKPSALANLLPRVKRVSAPATVVEKEVAAQYSHQDTFDITRASLGAANPYSNVLPVKNERQLPKSVSTINEDQLSNIFDISSKPSIEKIEEVRRWLLSYLPRLQQKDLQFYTLTLISDGFDSSEVLKDLDTDDLNFMKKGHKRVLKRKLQVEQKLDLELDPSSRKRIEMLVGASSKRVNEIALPTQNKTRVTSLESTPELAYDIFEASEKLEEAKEWVDLRNKLVEKRELDRSVSQRELPKPLGEERSNYDKVLLITSQNMTTGDEPQSKHDIVQSESELAKGENWIDEQNLLVEKRRLQRLAADGLPSAEEKFEYDISEASKELERIEAWIDEQNRLISERQSSRFTSQQGNTTSSMLSEEASLDSQLNMVNKTVSAASSIPVSQQRYNITKAGKDLAKIKAWIEEQNLHVAEPQLEKTASNSQSDSAPLELKSNVVKTPRENESKYNESDSSEAKNRNHRINPTPSAGKGIEDDRSAWYAEQNLLVEKRRIARIEAERKMRELES